MIKNVRDFNVKDKRILVRCDFNVPVDDAGNILDDFKIQKSLPTLQYLIKQGARVIVASHLGSPEGKVVEPLKLDNVKIALEKMLGIAVKKANDCVGQQVETEAMHLKAGEVLLLENVRFDKEETDNDQEFAKQLSAFADIYINDAFGVCHRNHASVALVPLYLPHGAGLLFSEELSVLSEIMDHPKKPLVVIVGGKKVETKAAFINNISKIANWVLVGGLIKKGIVDNNIKLNYPEKVVGPEGDLEAPDINEETLNMFSEKILQAKTVFWNGPLGKFEDEEYKKGTLAVAEAIIKSQAVSLIGGGETVEFLKKEGMLDKFSHVSPEGGAMLAYLSGEKLPGLEALK